MSKIRSLKIKTQPEQNYPDNINNHQQSRQIKQSSNYLPKIYGPKFDVRKKLVQKIIKPKCLNECFLYRQQNQNNHSKPKQYINQNRYCKPNQYINIGQERYILEKRYLSNDQNIKQTIKKIKTHKNEDAYNNLDLKISKLRRSLSIDQSKKIIRQNPLQLQSIHILRQPKQECKNKYCSCKSLIEQYQFQIQKKLKQHRMKKQQSRRNFSCFTRLPKIHKINRQKEFDNQSVSQTKPTNIQQCYSCHNRNNYGHKTNHEHQIRFNHENRVNKQTQHDKSIKAKKQNHINNKQTRIDKQIRSDKERQSRIDRQRQSRIGRQTQSRINTQSRYLQRQDVAIQTNIKTTNDYAIQTQNNTSNECSYTKQKPYQGFRYLQNKISWQKSMQNSRFYKNVNKKQPLQHLSHLKEKYKNSKRPVYQSKYQLDDESKIQYDLNKINQVQKVQRLKITKKYQNEQPPRQSSQQVEQIHSTISENSLTNHLVHALSLNKNVNKSTIFSKLRKKQLQSQNEGRKQNHSIKSYKYQNNENGQNSINAEFNQKAQSKINDIKKAKVKLINEQKGLFAIPQQNQYIQYLKGYKPIEASFNLKELIKSQNFRIIKNDDLLYFGQVSEHTNKVSGQNKHGKGLQITQRQIFQGTYSNGIKMSGAQRNIDGVYIGQFLNGKRHGNGKFLWNNGENFEGNWQQGTKNGYGIWKGNNQDSYQGNWLNNRQNGKGIYKHKASTYQGEFINFLKHGQGQQKFINGDLYIGSYQGGKPHGKGKYVWKNQTFYQGNFENGLRQGNGRLQQNINQYYEGSFKKDFKHGYGVQMYRDGDFFKGQYREGVRGDGIYTDVNGKQNIILQKTVAKQ